MCPDIGDGEVHVWVVPLTGPPVERRSLSESEHERMERFASAADRHRYGLAHAATRQILSAYLERSPQQVELRAAACGKPRVHGSDLEHSLAHAGDRALVAVGWRLELGVDLERVRNLPDAEALARSAFTPREQKRIACAGDHPRELLRLWTRKEALLKATGEGLRETTRELDVVDEHPRAGWRIVDLDLGSGYVGAVAVAAAVTRVCQRDWQKMSRPAGDGPARASGEEVLL